MPEPRWFPVVKDSRWKTGPTVPYVLGALHPSPLCSEEEWKNRLRQLLMSLRDDAPVSGHVVVQRCSEIDALVLAWKDGKEPEGRVRIASPKDDGRALYSCLIDGSSPTTIEDLLALLWERYGPFIVDSRFSRERGTWIPFSSVERARWADL